MSVGTTYGGVGASTATSRQIRIVPAEECDVALRDAIDRLDQQSPLVHPYQTEAFAALSNTDPTRSPYVILAEDGQGLAAFWWGYFVRYVTRPWPRSAGWARSGPVVRPDLVEQRTGLATEMLSALKAHVRKRSVGWLVIPSEALYGPELEGVCSAEGFSRRDLATFVIDLTAPPEKIWKRIHRTARRNVNQAEEHGLVIEEATSDDDIRSFHALRSERGAAPGEPRFPEDHYLQGCRRLIQSSQGRLLVARQGGRLLAGSLLLCHGGFAAHHQHAACPEGRQLRAGDLLLWHSLLAMKDAGCSRYDMVTVEVAPPPGSREAGIRDFKQKWGGELVETPAYRYWSPARRVWRSLLARLRR